MPAEINILDITPENAQKHPRNLKEAKNMSKWQFRYIDVVRQLILSGRVKSDEIAARLDVSTVTLARWRAKYPHFDREIYAAIEDVQALIRSRSVSTRWDESGALIVQGRLTPDDRCEIEKHAGRFPYLFVSEIKEIIESFDES